MGMENLNIKFSLFERISFRVNDSDKPLMDRVKTPLVKGIQALRGSLPKKMRPGSFLPHAYTQLLIDEEPVEVPILVSTNFRRSY
jgi:hypothetical protein